MHNIIKNKHHFVHKKYLESWCLDNRNIIGVRDKARVKEYNKSIDNIAFEDSFYKLNDITAYDYMVLSDLLKRNDQLCDIFKSLHFVHNFIMDTHNLIDTEKSHQLKKEFKNNVLEYLHYIFEDGFNYISRIIANNNLMCLDDDTANFKTIYYIWIQYFRTSASKDYYLKLIEEILPDQSNNENYIAVFEKHFHIIAFYFAIQSSIYHPSRIILLENNTETEFLTGSQPVILFKHPNYNGNSLYYPISPNKALLLVQVVKDELSHSPILLTSLEVEEYNNKLSECSSLIFCKSFPRVK